MYVILASSNMILQPSSRPSSSSIPSISPSLSAKPTQSPSESLQPSYSPSATTSPSGSPSVLSTCLPKARKIKIQAKAGMHLQLFDVQIFSSNNGACLTAGKSTGTSQSSTLETSTPASNAISYVGKNRRSFSYTGKGDPNAWWMIDLDGEHDIKSIYIGQHMCRYAPSPVECFCHLSESSVLLLDATHMIMANYTFGKVCFKRHVIEFDASYACEQQ